MRAVLVFIVVFMVGEVLVAASTAVLGVHVHPTVAGILSALFALAVVRFRPKRQRA